MLTDEIEKKRQQLITIASKYGLTSTKTLKCSQELDKLLDLYQERLKSKQNLYRNIC